MAHLPVPSLAYLAAPALSFAPPVASQRQSVPVLPPPVPPPSYPTSSRTSHLSSLPDTHLSAGSTGSARRHKVVFDLHLQHVALYDQPLGCRPLEKPLLWQASDVRSALKFRLRTRAPASVCLLMDDSQHEMLIPLSSVASLRVLPAQPEPDAVSSAEGGGGGGVGGSAERPSETKEEMEKRLRAGEKDGIVIELGIIKGCKKEFRRREPNRYVALESLTSPGEGQDGETVGADFTGGAARLTNLIRITVHSTVTPELSKSMACIVIRALRARNSQSASTDAIQGGSALADEGFLKAGWEFPQYADHVSPSLLTGDSFASPPRLPAVPSSSSAPNPRFVMPPQLTRSHTLPAYRHPSTDAQPEPARGSTDLLAGWSPPVTLLPEDEEFPLRLASPSLPLPRRRPSKRAESYDPETTPLVEQFIDFEHLFGKEGPRDLSYPYVLSNTGRAPIILSPPSPKTLRPLALPLAAPHPPPFSRSHSLGISTVSHPFSTVPTSRSATYPGSSTDFVAGVPESYWQARSRSSSSSSAWSVSTGGSTSEGVALRSDEPLDLVRGRTLGEGRGGSGWGGWREVEVGGEGTDSRRVSDPWEQTYVDHAALAVERLSVDPVGTRPPAVDKHSARFSGAAHAPSFGRATSFGPSGILSGQHETGHGRSTSAAGVAFRAGRG